MKMNRDSDHSISVRKRWFEWSLSLFILCLLIPSIAHAEETVQEYLDNLHSQGKERVMVELKDEVDPSLIERYGWKAIRGFNTINGLLCEISVDSIEPLKREDAVLEVVPDIIIKIQQKFGTSQIFAYSSLRFLSYVL